MGMTHVERIIAAHAGVSSLSPGDILDISIDVRVARDFGGANVVKNIRDHVLEIDDPAKTWFTFDCNPTGSDQKYAVNQHVCRQFARERNINLFDIHFGIGTHVIMEEGIAIPGSTVVSTDSHANIVGAIGAFGQGMGDQDIAASFANGKLWFKVPPSVKMVLSNEPPPGVYAKDIILNLLARFGANSLLGHSIEISGSSVDEFSIDERITISSMATEMGAIIILFQPDNLVSEFLGKAGNQSWDITRPDRDAVYNDVINIDLSTFYPAISRPGKPHDVIPLNDLPETLIDSAFIGSCTNGRIEDLRIAARILKNKKVAPGVILKIVPATDRVWKQALDEGLINIFKEAGALVSNPGCAGCAAGQVGQNGPGEVTVSTGNRNFPGKQGKGDVYLASPSTVAASAVAGFITGSDRIPEKPKIHQVGIRKTATAGSSSKKIKKKKPVHLNGRVWIILEDNIDTDMIYHNRYLAITDVEEMGKYTFDNLEGFENFASEAKEGDIIITGKNFGAGSSRQQAVDCFKSLGIQAIIAKSFGAIYERNAINAALPVLTYNTLKDIHIEPFDMVSIDLKEATITNKKNGKKSKLNPVSNVQMKIYKDNGIF